MDQQTLSRLDPATVHRLANFVKGASDGLAKAVGDLNATQAQLKAANDAAIGLPQRMIDAGMIGADQVKDAAELLQTPLGTTELLKWAIDAVVAARQEAKDVMAKSAGLNTGRPAHDPSIPKSAANGSMPGTARATVWDAAGEALAAIREDPR